MSKRSKKRKASREGNVIEVCSVKRVFLFCMRAQTHNPTTAVCKAARKEAGGRREESGRSLRPRQQGSAPARSLTQHQDPVARAQLRLQRLAETRQAAKPFGRLGPFLRLAVARLPEAALPVARVGSRQAPPAPRLLHAGHERAPRRPPTCAGGKPRGASGRCAWGGEEASPLESRRLLPLPLPATPLRSNSLL